MQTTPETVITGDNRCISLPLALALLYLFLLRRHDEGAVLQARGEN
jgi:hypothetical protein